MADKNNITPIDVHAVNKPAMILDLNSSYLSKESYAYARNLMPTTVFGDVGTGTMEQSITLCASAPYPIIGHITLPNNKLLIFSTDNSNMEIGVIDEKACTYTKLYTPITFGWNTNYPPITGEAKHDFNQKTLVTFGNKKIPVRRIILEDLPFLSDEDSTLFFKHISVPTINVSRASSGTLPNGTYSFAMAYMVDDIVYSDYYAVTKRVELFSENGANGLTLEIEGLDREFEKYQLVVIANVNGVITPQIVGEYSTRVKSITYTQFNTAENSTIKLETLVVKKQTWQAAGIIRSNSNYLIFADLVRRPELSYQREAMQIVSEYVVDQVPLDFYEGLSEDVGYWRDEVQDFYIEGLYNTGEFTAKFHIGGPKPSGDDMSIASGDDVYEYDKQFTDCYDIGKVRKWQTENTAGPMIPLRSKTVCNRTRIGWGKIGFWQSTEPYPQNEYLFGDDAGQPIRYHKMPDECKVPRYTVIDGVTYINIIGVRFKNIAPFSDPDIIGYRITRSKTDKTVVARGLFTNVRGYKDTVTDTDVLYTNYPVNDLSPDILISEKQTAFKKGKETNFSAASTVYQDKFNFYSPHMYFNERYILGNEVKFESEETGVIKGGYENVFGHPQAKLLSDTSFWIAAMIGFIETYLVLMGKMQIGGSSSVKLGTDGGTTSESHSDLEIKTIDDLLHLNLAQVVQTTVQTVSSLNYSGIIKILQVLQAAVALILSAGVKVAYAGLKGLTYANQLLDEIQQIIGFTDYAKQFNGVATFNKSTCITKGNRRRRTTSQPEYLSPDLHSIGEFTYQNFQRETTALFELNKIVSNPRIADKSRWTIGSAKLEKTPDKKLEQPISAFYGTSKVSKPAQYGQLGSSESIVMHNDILTGEESPVLYGGDCIIGRMQIMKKLRFFRQDLATEFGNENPPNFPNSSNQNGLEYDYKLYPNIAYPRYWIDTTKYDYSQLLRKSVVNRTTFSRTVTSKYNLDGFKKPKDTEFRVNDAYFYTSSDSVLDFIVEADYNINFREKDDNRHYSKHNTSLSLLFRPQLAQFPEKFKLDKAFYNISANEIFAEQIRDTFTPETAFPTNQPNSVIYSLPSFNLQAIDNWQYMLPSNFFSFREGDFGTLTGIHKLDQDRLIFTFSNSSPYISMGRDFLELDGTGRKVTIGDGGLFAQDPREILPTETNHGHTTSRYAFKNTHLGRLYPSAEHGLVFNFAEGLNDVTDQGIYFWAKKYMPLQITDYFPTYTNTDNPISGAGYLMAMDSMYEMIYITKRDFIPKYPIIEYKNEKFYFQGLEVSIRDEKYFEDVSWTLSYSPRAKAWNSFHDWHPDWIIQTNKHFMSVKGNQVWKHNENFNSFCNYYGKQYPFEIALITSAPQREILRSVECIVEGYKYKNFGRDRAHIFGEWFDRMQVWNSEQMSPILDMVRSSENPEDDIEFPKYKGNNVFDIVYTIEEGKYRVNQFWDAVKDRGEFTNAEFHLMATHPSGYKFNTNLLALDSLKPEEERKKFRHEWTKILFTKLNPNDIQLILKMFSFKKTISIR